MKVFVIYAAATLCVGINLASCTDTASSPTSQPPSQSIVDSPQQPISPSPSPQDIPPFQNYNPSSPPYQTPLFQNLNPFSRILPLPQPSLYSLDVFRLPNPLPYIMTRIVQLPSQLVQEQIATLENLIESDDHQLLPSFVSYLQGVVFMLENQSNLRTFLESIRQIRQIVTANAYANGNPSGPNLPIQNPYGMSLPSKVPYGATPVEQTMSPYGMSPQPTFFNSA